MSKKLLCIVLSLTMVFTMSMFMTGCGAGKEESYKVPDELTSMYDSYIDKIDVDYGNKLATELSTNPEFFSTKDLGGRNAGSEAEHKTAAYLAKEMKKIGLTDVEKAGAKCDVLDNRGSTLNVGGKEYTVYAYACKPTPKSGIDAEIVYMGDGTAAQYEKADVKGKIVLVDINQRTDWWVTYPMLEAEHQGAAGVLVAQKGGFSEIADDALNANDICAPMSIPTVSISAADSKALQKQIKAGKTTGNLTVNNITSKGDGTTYNVFGKIKGKNSDHQIIYGAHYDCHYYGFQDDNCAVAQILTIAKAMIDSGYTPENDIVFCLHGAEEWGSYDTQFDWTTGAWEMINTIHPEWVGKTLAFLNFELPAYKFADYAYSNSAPAFYKMIDFFTNTYPLSGDKSLYSEGIKTEGYQAYTYSDDFTYYRAGVPTVINGFLLQEDQENVYDFYPKYYHTNYDKPDIWDGDVFKFNAEYYGSMALYIDQMPALYLDFTGDYDRMKAAFDEDLLKAHGVDTEKYAANLKAFGKAAKANAAKVNEINDAYIQAWIDGDKDKMASLKKEGTALTDKNLKTFKFVSDKLLSTMYEMPVVPHEAAQINIGYMNQILDCLAKGDINTAVDEYTWQVNNVLEWYSCYFSPEVIEIQDKCLWSDTQNMYWGNNPSFVKADVYDATVGLWNKYDTKEDTSKEQAIYKKAIKQQAKVMAKYANQEIKDMASLADQLAL